MSKMDKLKNALNTKEKKQSSYEYTEEDNDTAINMIGSLTNSTKEEISGSSDLDDAETNNFSDVEDEQLISQKLKEKKEEKTNSNSYGEIETLGEDDLDLLASADDSDDDLVLPESLREPKEPKFDTEVELEEINLEEDKTTEEDLEPIEELNFDKTQEDTIEDTRVEESAVEEEIQEEEEEEEELTDEDISVLALSDCFDYTIGLINQDEYSEQANKIVKSLGRKAVEYIEDDHLKEISDNAVQEFKDSHDIIAKDREELVTKDNLAYILENLSPNAVKDVFSGLPEEYKSILEVEKVVEVPVEVEKVVEVPVEVEKIVEVEKVVEVPVENVPEVAISIDNDYDSTELFEEALNAAKYDKVESKTVADVESIMGISDKLSLILDYIKGKSNGLSDDVKEVKEETAKDSLEEDKLEYNEGIIVEFEGESFTRADIDKINNKKFRKTNVEIEVLNIYNNLIEEGKILSNEEFKEKMEAKEMLSNNLDLTEEEIGLKVLSRLSKLLMQNLIDTYESEIYSEKYCKNLFNQYLEDNIKNKALFLTLMEEVAEKEEFDFEGGSEALDKEISILIIKNIINKNK